MKPKTKSRKQPTRRAFRFSGRWKREKRIALVGLMALASAALVFAMGARERSSPVVPKPAALVQPQAVQPGGRSYSKLALQPEADRMRRRLGQRFLTSGREVTVMTGMLTIGSDRQSIRVTRRMDDDGEEVEVSTGGRGSVLTWNQDTGASSSGRAASGTDRAVVERLALDSVDEFILAQLRGASYYTVARNVRPAEAGDSDDYEGPVWDVVRVGEPRNESANRPLSETRHYFINSATDLLEKVVSEEQGEAIVAELSGWVMRGGESMPTRIVWRRNKQIVMELDLDGFSNGPRQ